MRFAPGLLCLALAACGGVPVSEVPTPGAPAAGTGPAVPAPEDDSCGAAPYARLVGQPATALERELIMDEVRVIRPGMAVTMDYRANRINFEIGETGGIVRIYCG
ncbi:I78 family peptidase inhibitor [Pelagovum pacificum]|uniref:Peptidase inhibitor I78 family protein n=2 Tax=Pelagovum pacificum TaxID=2588711 RepID=A0A5C5GKU0_9RHOB|nr:I78 family peptidase inhibitor [Pelagovum pacificum]QQA45060.1 hypothetical protein I8N54_19680 [Pelagovum pacificum]TNY34391.1 hypothetical protein FHY64_11715 [Pelagovum pacificum]